MKLKGQLSSPTAGILRGGNCQGQGRGARTSATQDQVEGATGSGDPCTDFAQEDHDTCGGFESTDNCFASTSSRRYTSSHNIFRRRYERYYGTALCGPERSFRCAHELTAAGAHAQHFWCRGLTQPAYPRCQARARKWSVSGGHATLERCTSSAVALCAAHAYAAPTAISTAWCPSTERVPPSAGRATATDIQQSQASARQR